MVKTGKKLGHVGETWSRGTNSRLPFGVNVNLNLSINKPEAEEADGDVNETKDEVDYYLGEGPG